MQFNPFKITESEMDKKLDAMIGNKKRDASDLTDDIAMLFQQYFRTNHFDTYICPEENHFGSNDNPVNYIDVYYHPDANVVNGYHLHEEGVVVAQVKYWIDEEGEENDEIYTLESASLRIFNYEEVEYEEIGLDEKELQRIRLKKIFE